MTGPRFCVILKQQGAIPYVLNCHLVFQPFFPGKGSDVPCTFHGSPCKFERNAGAFQLLHKPSISLNCVLSKNSCDNYGSTRNAHLWLDVVMRAWQLPASRSDYYLPSVIGCSGWQYYYSRVSPWWLQRRQRPASGSPASPEVVSQSLVRAVCSLAPLFLW